MFRQCFLPAALFPSLFSAAVAAEDPQGIPEVARAMLDAAFESGDPAEIEAVAKAAKAVFPDHEAAIDEEAAAKIAALTPEEEDKVPEEAELPSYGVFAVSPWEGKISASAVATSGNSENAAVGVAIDAARTEDAWKHNFKGYFDLGRSNDETSQKRWGASYKLDYNFSDRTYLYGRFSYDEDQFSGFDYRLFAGGGLGHYFFEGDPFSWKVEAGPGFRFSPISGSTMEESELAVYGATEIDWLLSEDLKFEQDVNATWTEPTTTIQSVTAVTTQIWGSISAGVSFEYRYETDPPEDRKKTDTITKASLIYGF